MFPPGIAAQLDGLSDLGFDGLPGLEAGELPKFGSLEKGVGYGRALTDALDSIDDSYQEFKEAAKQSSFALGQEIADMSIDLAGTIAGATPLGPLASIAGPAMKKVLGFITKIGDNAQIRSEWVRCRKIEVDIVRKHLTGGQVMANRLKIPSYTDCTPMHDARRRLVVMPQKHNAPWLWLPPGLPSVMYNYPQPEGRVTKGFMVRCGLGSNAGEGNVERNKRRQSRKGMRRPSGYADFTALLYPWWCGNGPPRPAPAINKTSNAGNHYFSDPNIRMMAIQQQLLSDPLMNFFVPINSVKLMKASLKLFGAGPKNITNAKKTKKATDVQVAAAIELCSAFIDARVNFLKSDYGLSVLQDNLHSPSLDPELKSAFKQKPPRKPIGHLVSLKPREVNALIKKDANERKNELYLAAKRGEPIRLPPELMGSIGFSNADTDQKKSKSAAPVIIVGAAAAAAFMAMKKK